MVRLSPRQVVAAFFLSVAIVLSSGEIAAETSSRSTPILDQQEEEALLSLAREPWKGDMDQIIERGFIRIVTPYNPLFFFFAEGRARGLSVDVSRAFEEYLAKHTQRGARAPRVLIIPLPRDKILRYLDEGRADIAAANLTITPERSERFNFSNPIFDDIRELVVTGNSLKDIGVLDDLLDASIHVRKTSSYYEHLIAINETRGKDGKKPIKIIAADESLEDFDLLHMVDSGTIPAIIVDSHKAAVWSQFFGDIHVHEGISVNDGGEIAWATRPDTPKLLETVNEFVQTIKQGTLLGNIFINRYYKKPPKLDSLGAHGNSEEFNSVMSLFKKYGEEYALDWVLIAAQGYQESKFVQSTKSHAGAIGVMQVLPSTAADPNVGIEDITDLNNNIHAGVKYLKFLQERYFTDPAISPLDQVLFSFAAYNAGPAAINRARKKSQAMGFDHTVWFDHVEVAAARSISREPVNYVRNIFKYYVIMKSVLEANDQKKQAAQ